MQVIGSTGGSAVQGNYDVSWTVGELVVTTLNGTGRKLTQGFHQPDVCAMVSTHDLDLEALGIEVFPNPATSFLTIRYTDSMQTPLTVEGFDVMGSRVLAPTVLDTPEGTVLDATNWLSGVYFLRIHHTESRATATVRIVRL